MSLEFCKFSFTMLTTGTLFSSRRISTYLLQKPQILTLKKLQGENQVSLIHFELSESLCMYIWIILLVLQLLAVGCRMRHGHDGVLTLEWRRDRFVETCYSAVPHRVSSPSLSWSPASSPTQPPDWEAAGSWYTTLSPQRSCCSSIVNPVLLAYRE